MGVDVVHAEVAEVVDRGAETDGLDDRRGAGLELVRDAGVRRPLHRDGLDHLAAAEERRQLRRARSRRPQSTPMPVGPTTLWPVKARKSAPDGDHVDRQLRRGLRGVDHDDGADLVGPAGDLGDRVDRAEHVGDPGQRDDLGALGDQLVDVRQVEPAVVGEPEPAQRRAGALGEQLPRHDVGVVLHLGDDDLVARADLRAGPRAHASVLATRLSASEAFLVKITSSRDGRVDERRHLVAGVLERLGRLRAELVHGAGDVGVVALEVVDHRVDDDLRLLRGVGAVEVDQRAGPPASVRARIGKSLRMTSRSGSRPASVASGHGQTAGALRYLS